MDPEQAVAPSSAQYAFKGAAAPTRPEAVLTRVKQIPEQFPDVESLYSHARGGGRGRAVDAKAGARESEQWGDVRSSISVRPARLSLSLA